MYYNNVFTLILSHLGKQQCHRFLDCLEVGLILTTYIFHCHSEPIKSACHFKGNTVVRLYLILFLPTLES